MLEDIFLRRSKGKHKKENGHIEENTIYELTADSICLLSLQDYSTLILMLTLVAVILKNLVIPQDES
jgi:hypothetical protein